MKPGDVIETSVWVTGTETREAFEGLWKDLIASLAACERQEGVKMGPITWIEKHPGEDRVPPVPDHIQGPNVRLLICEAAVVEVIEKPKAKSFFADDLDPDTFERLAIATREHHELLCPGHPRLTDAQVRTLINDLGPEAALDTLRQGTVTVH